MKNSMVLGRSPYQWQHEPVLFGWMPNGQHRWFAGKNQSTIWQYDKPKRSKDHPTMKPVPLLAYPLQNSSAPNAVVLDTFGGSGSTLIACEQTSRICYMMELDERYASVIVQRYIDLVETSEDVSVLRGGQTFSFEEIVSE
jgi:DNA modification methylase